MSDILLSIVIPTKNRYEYLKVLVSAVLRFDAQNFEIIIQDNSEKNSEGLRYVDSVQDEKIIYNHTATWLSMSDNCDYGVGLARGKYIIMLGDDDGVTEEIIEIAEWMFENEIDAALTNKPIYLWPGIQSKVLGVESSGSLLLNNFNNKIVKIDSSKQLKRVLELGGTEIRYLPRVYHGIVSRKCLDQLKAETGSYFPGPSPDMANAVGLCKYVDKFYWIDRPVIITGNAPKSAAGQGLSHTHIGKIEDQKSLPINTAENWSDFVPKFWSGQTIWAEALLKSLDATHRKDQKIGLNYYYLYAACFVFQKPFKELTNETIRKYRVNHNESSLKIYLKIYLNILKIFRLRLVSFLQNICLRFISSNKVGQLDTIADATNYLTTKCSSMKIQWKSFNSSH